MGALVSTAVLQSGLVLVVSAALLYFFFTNLERAKKFKLRLAWTLRAALGGACAFAAALVSIILFKYLDLQLGREATLVVTALVEELCKFATLMVILERWALPAEDDAIELLPSAGAAAGLILGFTFGIIETLGYGLGSWTTLIARELSAVPLHGIIAAFYGYMHGRFEFLQPNRKYLVLVVCCGTLVHAIYNTLTLLEFPFNAFSSAFVVALGFALWRLLKSELRS